MKQLILILVLSISFSSCKKNDPALTNKSTPPSSTSTLTITVNSPTITAGQTATLTASGATSYSWSTGATTNSITVSPSVTSNYTVTGTQGTNTGTATAVVTVTTGTTTATDSVWIKMSIEAPVGGSFNYRYDTANTRILLNGHRLLNSQWYINYENLNVTNINLSLDVVGYSNFTSTPKYLHMNSGDSLTFIIDSLYYTNTNPAIRGGNILIGINTKPTVLSNLINAKIYTSANNIDTVTYLPVGRAMGNALANGQGGSTQNFYWYLGGKFRYTWVKP